MSINFVKCITGAALLAAAALAAAAPVVVTPGSLAGYSFSPPSSSGGGGSSSGGVETLATCRVTPTKDTRTITLSTRNWYGYAKPVTVLYKIVGGGAGHAPLPQLQSAGGSSVILKNGVVVAHAPGMNAGGTNPSVASGSFTVTSSDSLTFVLGGGGGGGSIGNYLYMRQLFDADGNFAGYAYERYYTGISGGGGAGYYGGGTGAAFSNVLGYPAATAAIAYGGTSTAGGSGYRSGSLGAGGGGGGVAGGGVGLSNGADVSYTLAVSSGMNVTSVSGGGGRYGYVGLPGGEATNASPSCPVVSGADAFPPLATTFDLSPNAGRHGSSLGGLYNNSQCGYPGGGYGEIVLQYQAPACDLIPQYNQQ